MTISLPALNNLFGGSAAKPAASATPSGLTIRGPCPYEKLRSLDWLDKRFVAVVEAIKSDPHWGIMWNGDLSAYGGDHSRADLALCGDLARRGLKAGAIDVALRCSKLFRTKWERDDYRNATIEKALANFQSCTVVATPDLNRSDGRISVSTNPPAPRPYFVSDLLMPSKAAILAGFGGSSKTQLALQMGVAIALGTPFVGKVVKSGNVVVILGEEDRTEVERRISAYARHNGLDPSDISDIEQCMTCFPLVGQDIRLTIADKKAVSETAFAQVIIDRVGEIGDVRLIVLDHIGLLHGGELNAGEDAAQTMRVVNRIAQETGAAVLVLAHTPKNASQLEVSDASMVAGSTAFVDQARAAWIMAAMREKEVKRYGVPAEKRQGYVSLTVVKSNYGLTGDVFWFKRFPFDGVGLLEYTTLSEQAATSKTIIDLHQRLIDFVRTHRGHFSKTRLRDPIGEETRTSKG